MTAPRPAGPEGEAIAGIRRGLCDRAAWLGPSPAEKEPIS